MHFYLNTHYALQQQRQQALESGTQGPRLMVNGICLHNLMNILVLPASCSEASSIGNNLVKVSRCVGRWWGPQTRGRARCARS